jgi:hypothetical protein
MQRARSCGDVAWETDDMVEAVIGALEPATGSASEYPAAILWLPDPEARRGWREYYVEKRREHKARPLGYRARPDR